VSLDTRNPLALVARWFCSSTLRRALDLRRHVRTLLRAQVDLLQEEAAAEVQSALDKLSSLIRSGGARNDLIEAMAGVQAASFAHLRDRSRHWPSEACEMLLVALTVVMAIRTFGVQAMKIPSGSMQPTLYGITTTNLRNRTDLQIPSGFRAVVERLVFGRRYFHIVAETDGRLAKIEDPEPIFPWLRGFSFLTKQRFQVGETWYTIWMPPSELPTSYNINPNYVFFVDAGMIDIRMRPHRVYHRGEDIVKMLVTSGDQLLVDRFTYNFRRPRRGEIIVFRTTDVPGLQPGTHYIKRLVGLPGERVRIGNDRHAIINDERLDAANPGFDRVYSFAPQDPPAENKYSGHVNDLVARLNGQIAGVLAPRFESEGKAFKVHPGRYLVFGDNTMNSYDGRRWGDFQQENTVGRFLAVYWPMSDRFGLGQD